MNSDNATVVSPRRVIGSGAPSSNSGTASLPDAPAGEFRRDTSGGSFQLQTDVDNSNYQLCNIYTMCNLYV